MLLNKLKLRINTIESEEFNLNVIKLDNRSNTHILNNTYLLYNNFYFNNRPNFYFDFKNKINNKYKYKIGTRLIIGVISDRYYNVYDRYYLINNIFYREIALLKLKNE